MASFYWFLSGRQRDIIYSGSFSVSGFATRDFFIYLRTPSPSQSTWFYDVIPQVKAQVQVEIGFDNLAESGLTLSPVGTPNRVLLRIAPAWQTLPYLSGPVSALDPTYRDCVLQAGIGSGTAFIESARQTIPYDPTYVVITSSLTDTIPNPGNYYDLPPASGSGTMRFTIRREEAFHASGVNNQNQSTMATSGRRSEIGPLAIAGRPDLDKPFRDLQFREFFRIGESYIAEISTGFRTSFSFLTRSEGFGGGPTEMWYRPYSLLSGFAGAFQYQGTTEWIPTSASGSLTPSADWNGLITTAPSASVSAYGNSASATSLALSSGTTGKRYKGGTAQSCLAPPYRHLVTCNFYSPEGTFSEPLGTIPAVQILRNENTIARTASGNAISEVFAHDPRFSVVSLSQRTSSASTDSDITTSASYGASPPPWTVDVGGAWTERLARLSNPTDLRTTALYLVAMGKRWEVGTIRHKGTLKVTGDPHQAGFASDRPYWIGTFISGPVPTTSVVAATGGDNGKAIRVVVPSGSLDTADTRGVALRNFTGRLEHRYYRIRLRSVGGANKTVRFRFDLPTVVGSGVVGNPFRFTFLTGIYYTFGLSKHYPYWDVATGADGEWVDVEIDLYRSSNPFPDVFIDGERALPALLESDVNLNFPGMILHRIDVGATIEIAKIEGIRKRTASVSILGEPTGETDTLFSFPPLPAVPQPGDDPPSPLILQTVWEGTATRLPRPGKPPFSEIRGGSVPGSVNIFLPSSDFFDSDILGLEQFIQGGGWDRAGNYLDQEATGSGATLHAQQMAELVQAYPAAGDFLGGGAFGEEMPFPFRLQLRSQVWGGVVSEEDLESGEELPGVRVDEKDPSTSMFVRFDGTGNPDEDTNRYSTGAPFLRSSMVRAKLDLPPSFRRAERTFSVTDRRRYWVLFFAPSLPGGVSPWNDYSSFGFYAEVYIEKESGRVRFRRSRVGVPQGATGSESSQFYPTTTVSRVEDGIEENNESPCLCILRSSRFLVAFVHRASPGGATGGIYLSQSDDDGDTWQEAEYITMGKAPDIVEGAFGEILLTWLETGSGSGYPRLRGRYREAGDLTYSEDFTLEYLDGSTRKKVPVSEDSHRITVAREGKARFVLTCVVEGETLPSQWGCSDDFTTWERLIPGL